MVTIRAFIAAGLCAAAVVTILIGLFSNGWQTSSTEESNDFFTMSMEMNVGLREIEVVSQFGGESGSESVDLADLADEEDDYETSDYFKDLNTAGLVTYIILWVAVALCVSTIVFAILGATGVLSGTWGIILGFIGGGSMLVASILYAAMNPSIPGELENDFSPFNDLSLGWTYYMVLIGGVSQCVGGGLMIGVKKKRFPRSTRHWVSPTASDGQYTSDHYEHQRHGSSESWSTSCIRCHAPMRYIFEYRRWFCDSCGEYAPPHDKRFPGPDRSSEHDGHSSQPRNEKHRSYHYPPPLD